MLEVVLSLSSLLLIKLQYNINVQSTHKSGKRVEMRLPLVRFDDVENLKCSCPSSQSGCGIMGTHHRMRGATLASVHESINTTIDNHQSLH